MSLLFDNAASEHLNDSSWTEVTGAPFTMGAWVKKDASGAQAIISLGDVSTDNNYFTLRHANTNLLQGLMSSAAGAVSWQTAADFSQDVWHLCVYVETATNNRNVFLDGVAATADTNSRTPTGIDNLAIGASARSTTDTFFSGRVFWPFVYDVALSATDITALSLGVSPRAVQGNRLVSFVPTNIPAVSTRDVIRGVTFTDNNTVTFDPNDNPLVARLGPRGRGRLARVG